MVAGCRMPANALSRQANNEGSPRTAKGFMHLPALVQSPRSPRLAPSSHGSGEEVEDADGVLPPDAAVRDALAIDELVPRDQVLASGDEMALDHDADDALFSSADL